MKPPTPVISVVIPTYGRPEPLSRCLAALECQTLAAADFEVIVVDDGSPTPVALLAERMGTAQYRVVRQENAGPAAARNRGAREAKGTFLAFTDDDCAPHTGWLEALLGTFAGHPEAMVGGRTVNVLPTNPYSAASQELITYLYDYFNSGAEGPRFFASNNLAVPTAAFLDMGGFDETFPLAAAEDREFCDRWLHLGRKLVYAPAAIVNHAHALSLRRFWRQHFNYGRGAYQFQRIREQRAQATLKREPLHFYLDLVRSPLTHQEGTKAALYQCGLLGLSQAANVLGYFREALPARIQTRPKSDQS
jgi:GT2 family glycosyltransferase